MGPIQVVVEDGNNLVLEVTPTPNTTVILDRGIAGPVGPQGPGDVDGPASATDNAVARFDGTTGKLIQNSLVTVSDTGAVAGVTTLAASGAVTLSGLTASTALALDASKNVVSVTNTGTGNNVLSNSPTLVTPALGTPASGVVTNLTGTASININGTVGATTASTGAFTTLTTSSTVTHNGGTANGVAYLNGSNVLTTGVALTYDGTAFRAPRAIITTADSSYAAAFNATTGNARISGYDSSYGSTALVAFSAGYAGYGPFSIDALNHRWWISGSEQMRLTSTGLGIGTSSPTDKLQVGAFSGNNVITIGAGTAGNSSLYFGDGTGADRFRGYVNYEHANDAMVFATAATERMRLDASGNLGLGVTPSASTVRAFQVPDSAVIGSQGVNLNITANAYFDSSFKYHSTGAATWFQSSAGSFTWRTAPSGTAGNAISFTQAMTLDASGRLAIGATSASNTLDVAASGGATFRVYDSADVGRGLEIRAGSAASGLSTIYTNTSVRALAFGTNNTERARIDSSGNFGIGTSSPGSKLDVSGTGNFQGLQVSGSPSLSFGANKWMTQQETGFARTYFCGPDASTYQGWEIYRATSTGTPVLHTVFDASGNLQMKSGANVVYAPAPASITAAATLTNANIQGQIIVATGSGPYTVTMPLGTTLETLIPWSGTNLGYDFTIINNSGDDLTVAVNTGVTAVGLLVVPSFGNTSAGFRIRRTAANTFVLYRLS